MSITIHYRMAVSVRRKFTRVCVCESQNSLPFLGAHEGGTEEAAQAGARLPGQQAGPGRAARGGRAEEARQQRAGAAAEGEEEQERRGAGCTHRPQSGTAGRGQWMFCGSDAGSQETSYLFGWSVNAWCYKWSDVTLLAVVAVAVVVAFPSWTLCGWVGGGGGGHLVLYSCILLILFMGR